MMNRFPYAIVLLLLTIINSRSAYSAYTVCPEKCGYQIGEAKDRSIANCASLIYDTITLFPFKCLCENTTYSCIGDLYNYCSTANIVVVPIVRPCDFNCYNITSSTLLSRQNCICRCGEIPLVDCIIKCIFPSFLQISN